MPTNKITEAEAILELAKAIDRINERLHESGVLTQRGLLSHEICMGIRHGLFGAHADQNSNITNINITTIE